MAALAHVVHFTDPGCPYAWSAEPLMRLLEWRYGDQISWETVMVGLADSPEVYAAQGMTPARVHAAWEEFAQDYGMPIDLGPRDRVGATGPACIAVVAAQLHAPERADALLRALRVRFFSEGFLDDPALIAHAAQDAGIDPEALAVWTQADDTLSIYADHMLRARRPSPEGLAQDDRLGSWEGGRRYTCPSLEITRESDRLHLAAPGFQPRESYEMLLGNALPYAAQRAAAQSVGEVLAWAPFPLATAEIAELRGISPAEARDELVAADATEIKVANDALWSAA